MRAWGKAHRELVLGYPKEPNDDADPCISLTNSSDSAATAEKARLKRHLAVEHLREQKGAFLSADPYFEIILPETE
jgi:hypothetical protein